MVNDKEKETAEVEVDSVVAIGEGDAMEVEIFLGYLASPVTWIVSVCRETCAIARGTTTVAISAKATIKSFLFKNFTSETLLLFLSFLSDDVIYKRML